MAARTHAVYAAGVKNLREGSVSRATAWDQTYAERGATAVSWYEAGPRMSLEIVEELRVPVDQAVIDVGGGAAALASELVARGHMDVTVLEISATAITEAQKHSPAVVKWLQADILTWRAERTYGLWHDRAVLHFFTEESERQAYRQSLDAGVADDGYVVLATFAPEGPDRCSGLPVRRYSAHDLQMFLGDEYVAVIERQDDHITPSGSVQPLTWNAFQRRAPA